MAVQPLNPFAGEVSQVISISLPSSVPAVKVDFRVNVFENPYVFNAFVGQTDAKDFWQPQQSSCPKYLWL